jgi:hypothetical protein
LTMAAACISKCQQHCPHPHSIKTQGLNQCQQWITVKA